MGTPSIPKVSVLPAPVVLNRVESKVDVHGDEYPTDIGNGAYSVRGDVVAQSAGTFGDLPRFLQTLPGVVGASDLQNAMMVRGGNPFENTARVDGFEVTNLNHLALSGGSGGIVSMLDTGLIDHATLFTTTTPADTNLPLSSLLEIKTVNPKQDSYAMDAGFAGAGVRVGRMLSPDTSLSASARQSVVNYLTDDIGLNGTPKFSNLFGKFFHQNDGGGSLTVDALAGKDSLHMVPTWNDAWETNAYNTDYAGSRLMVGARWHKVHQGGSTSAITVSDSEQTQSLQQYDQVQQYALNFQQNNREGTTELKYGYLTDPTETNVRVHMGLDLHIHRIAYDQAQPLGLLSPYSASTTPIAGYSYSPTIHSVDKAPFIEYSNRGKRLFLRGSFRYVEWGSLSGNTGLASSATAATSRSTAASSAATCCCDQDLAAATSRKSYLPQVHAGFLLSNRFMLTGSYGRYAQQVPFALTASSTDNLTLAPINETHLSTGLSITASTWLQITTEVFRKSYSNYPVAQDFPQLSLANILPNLGEAFSYMTMTSAGKGIAQGIQLDLRQQRIHHLFLDANVSFSSTKFAGLDGVMRSGNWDYPVVANVTGGIDVKHVLITFRNTFTSGKPYTPILGAASEQQNRMIYNLDQINAFRGPLYNRTDIAINRSYRLRNAVMDTHFGFQNLFNRENFYAYFWRPRCPQCGPIAEPAMGIMPDFGFSLRF